MDIAGLKSWTSSSKPPVLFNTNGLDANGLAKIEQSVKAARETLALADRMQTMRDVTTAVWKTYDQLKRSSSLARPGSTINFSL